MEAQGNKNEEIIFAEAGTFGYKRPTLWIKKENEYIKIASFESEGKMEMFMHLIGNKWINNGKS